VASRGAGPPSVNLELPDISETTTDRKLNLNIWYSTRIGYKNIILYDTSWGRLPYWFSINVHLRGRLRPITARRLSAYMSSRALATTTTSSSYYNAACNIFIKNKCYKHTQLHTQHTRTKRVESGKELKFTGRVG